MSPIKTMKYLLLLFLVGSTFVSNAQIAIPTGNGNVVVPCVANNYSATLAAGAGGTGVEWFSDYLCTTSLGVNTTYNGVAATSTMIYAKSTNGAASSVDPKQVYIFKPQNPTASFVTADSCTSVSITITVASRITTIIASVFTFGCTIIFETSIRILFYK